MLQIVREVIRTIYGKEICKHLTLKFFVETKDIFPKHLVIFQD
jgi:hypothetical protein